MSVARPEIEFETGPTRAMGDLTARAKIMQMFGGVLPYPKSCTYTAVGSGDREACWQERDSLRSSWLSV